jgi:hypothetical protein
MFPTARHRVLARRPRVPLHSEKRSANLAEQRRYKPNVFARRHRPLAAIGSRLGQREYLRANGFPETATLQPWLGLDSSATNEMDNA